MELGLKLAGILWLVAGAAATAAPEMLPRDWAQPVPPRQVTVIAPASERATALAEALRGAGASVETLMPEAALREGGLLLKPELLSRTLVFLGGLHTNRALLPLYVNYLSFADATYPGGEGFVLRAIPHPFGPGTAALALEASSPAGEQAAVARCTELLAGVKEGEFPYTLETHLPEEVSRRVQSLMYGTLRFALTGTPALVPAALASVQGAVQAGQGFAAAGDYGIERWVRECQYLQDAPGVSAKDQQALDQALFDTLAPCADQYWRSRNGQAIGSRHNTMGTSCFTAAVQLLLRRGHPNPEAREILERYWGECVAYWTNAASTFHDDIEGFPSYCSPEPTTDWALSLGLSDYLGKVLPLSCLRALAVTDPMGFYAGTGTYEECRPGDVYKQMWGAYPLRVADYFHPGEGYGWLRDNLGLYPGNWAVGRSQGDVRGFGTGAVSARPDRLLGVTVLPLGEYRYSRLAHDRDSGVAQHKPYLPAPLERCFEKLCFRDSFTPQSQYLVLQGFQTPLADNAPPRDPNAIIRFTDLGHVWLHSNTEKQGNLARSAVFCTDGRNDTPQAAGCELQTLHSGTAVGLAASRLSDYTACDWTRNLIWRRGRYFAVIDLMEQTREGQFGLICTFRTPQRAWLQPDGMLAREGEAQMRLRNADAVRLALDGGDEVEGAAVPTLLRQTQELSGQPGDLRCFRNVLFATDPTRPGDLQVRPLGASAMLLKGTLGGQPELALVAAVPAGQKLQLPGVQSDAQVLYLAQDQWAQAGGTGITLGNVRLTGAEGTAPPSVAAVLERLWREAQSPARPGRAASAALAAAPLWQTEAFTPLSEPVAAPAVKSEPEPRGVIGTLFDRVVTWWPTVTWPAGEVKLTLDLRQPAKLAQIDFQTGVFGAYNTIPDPAQYPAARTVEAEFSSDGFKRDLRKRTLAFSFDCTFERLHKGSVFPIGRWTCRDVGEPASHVRLTFAPAQWPGSLALSELSIRQAGGSAVNVAGLVQRDLNGDGKLETMLWSDQAEFAVLSGEGKVLLRKRMPGAITAVECYPDLLPGGSRLLVTTREARLYCLKADGTEEWRVDFLESAKQNTDLPTAYSIGLLKRPDGRPLIVTGNYNLASFVEPDGKLAGFCRLPAAFQTMTLSRGFDYDGDGGEETVSTEVWGVLSVLDTHLKRKAGAWVPRGRGILLDYLTTPTREHAKVVLCTENGLGVLDLPTMKFDWRHDINPLSACVKTDLDGDGQPEIIVGKEDGYLLVYAADGTLRQSRLIGEAVRAVAAVNTPGGWRLVAALPGRIATYGVDLTGEGVLGTGHYSRLQVTGEGRLLAVTGGGHVVAFGVRGR